MLLFLTSLGLAPPRPPLLGANVRSSVYIEDTDAFGVTFYANYLRFYERAACEFLGLRGCARAKRDAGLLVGVDAFRGMRYSAPALLGDELNCHVELKGIDEQGRLSFGASLERATDGSVLNSVSDLRLAFRGVESSAIDAPPWGCFHLQLDDDALQPAAQIGLTEDDAGLATATAPDRLCLQPDELGGGGGLTMHTALRYFERQRTSLIGGPDALKGLQDSGTQVVVGRIDAATLFDAAASATLGDEVEPRCRLKLKARDTMVVFEQWLVARSSGTPLARADVTCLCLDVEEGKMGTVPQWLREGLAACME